MPFGNPKCKKLSTHELTHGTRGLESRLEEAPYLDSWDELEELLHAKKRRLKDVLFGEKDIPILNLAKKYKARKYYSTIYIFI